MCEVTTQKWCHKQHKQLGNNHYIGKYIKHLTKVFDKTIVNIMSK